MHAGSCVRGILALVCMTCLIVRACRLPSRVRSLRPLQVPSLSKLHDRLELCWKGMLRVCMMCACMRTCVVKYHLVLHSIPCGASYQAELLPGPMLRITLAVRYPVLRKFKQAYFPIPVLCEIEPSSAACTQRYGKHRGCDAPVPVLCNENQAVLHTHADKKNTWL